MSTKENLTVEKSLNMPLDDIIKMNKKKWVKKNLNNKNSNIKERKNNAIKKFGKRSSIFRNNQINKIRGIKKTPTSFNKKSKLIIQVNSKNNNRIVQKNTIGGWKQQQKIRAINRIKKLKAERRLKQSNAKKMQNNIKNKLLITIKNNEKINNKKEKNQELKKKIRILQYKNLSGGISEKKNKQKINNVQKSRIKNQVQKTNIINERRGLNKKTELESRKTLNERFTQIIRNIQKNTRKEMQQPIKRFERKVTIA
jgi:hypothetical protein